LPLSRFDTALADDSIDSHQKGVNKIVQKWWGELSLEATILVDGVAKFSDDGSFAKIRQGRMGKTKSIAAFVLDLNAAEMAPSHHSWWPVCLQGLCNDS